VKRRTVTWSNGAPPGRPKRRGRAESHSPVKTDEKHYNNLLPHLTRPGGLFRITEDCVGDLLELDGHQILHIVERGWAKSSSFPLQSGITALHLGVTNLSYKTRGAQVNRVAHEFLIAGRRWIISDLRMIQPAYVEEENDEE